MRYVSIFMLVLAAATAAHPPVEPADPADWWNQALASRAIKAAADLEPPSEEEVPYHTADYYVSLVLDPGGSPLITDAGTDLQIVSDTDGLTEVVLDLVDLTVDEVYDDYSPCSYTHEGGLLTVTLNTPLDTGEGTSIYVSYHGDPTDGMWYSTANGGIVYTCGCPDVTRNWFPCRDWNFEKAPSITVVTIDSTYDVTSNGHQVSDVPVGGGRHRVTFETRDAIAPYLVMLSATNYSYYRDWFYGDADVPIDYYVYPGMEDDAHADFDYTVPTCMGVYEGLFGSYPFERAGYCVSPLPYGGMEHQTCISLLASLVNGSGSNYAIFVHEMAHQWFGDAVTAHTWKECWLNEGFATYCEVVYDEDQDGDEGRRYRLQIHRNRYDIGDNNRQPIYDPDPIFGYLPYYKGSWVLNMLRHLMGDADFYPCLADYLADRLYSWATTEILKDNTENFWDGNEHYPDSDMDWFFDQWVYMAGHPEYEWWWWTEGSGPDTVLHLHLDQVQSTEHETPYVFEMPVDFGVEYASRADEVVTVWMDERSQEFAVEVDDDVDSVEFDPGYWLLCDHEDHTAVDHAEARVSATGDGLLVDWETEGDVVGVELHRRDGLGETKLHESLLPAAGRFLDRSLPGAGSYSYRLVAHAADGATLEFTTEAADWVTPGGPLALAAPFPNPAATTVTIGFNLPRDGAVGLSVYDLAGRRVATLVDTELTAGRHDVTWETDGVPSGVYVLRLMTDYGSLTRRLVVAR
jgi:hypothetical protein